MRLLEWALVQCDWCPCKKRRLGQRQTETHTPDTCTHREKTTGRAPSKCEGGRLQPFQNETNPADTLILDF